MIGTSKFSTADTSHKKKTLKNGVPQGSVQAVTLFLLAMNTVFQVVPKDVRILVYADDILLVAASKQLSTVRRKLLTVVSAVNDWAKKVRFRLSAFKSCVLHVCQRKKTQKSAGKISNCYRWRSNPRS